MIKPIKFLSGLVSNALTQTVRCLWNIAACMARLAFSLLCVFMATLQFGGGGRSQSKTTLALMVSTLRLSLECGLTGLLQGLGVLTLSSPLLRAAQACSEEISPKGILLPCGSDRNLAQRILGLNSWEEQRREKEAPMIPEIRMAPQPPTGKERASAEEAKIEASATRVRSKQKAKANAEAPTPPKRTYHPAKSTRKSAEHAAWGSLVKQYLEARTIEEMDRVRNKMALEHTRSYLRALKAASKYRSKKKAA